MSLVAIPAGGSARAAAARVDLAALRRDLESSLEGEVRFDKISRALYSTDASVYQIEPLGVVIPKSREDVVRLVGICGRHGCPITARGGGTSQAGQAVGEGIQLDFSKYLNRLLEVNPAERWARVEPGIVLDELNATLRPHGLRFAPDISTASRATVGGMMANNSSGARSVLYGKTIDHVLEQHVVLADASLAHLHPLSPAALDSACSGATLEARACRAVRRIAAESAGEIERRFPKVLRRVGGYNLDEFTDPDRPFNLAKLMVGSEGTLGMVVEAKIRLVELPKAKAVLAIQFADLLEALAATPAILAHRPSAVEVMDRFILGHTRQNAALERLRRSFIEGDPGALLCVEFYADRAEDLPPRLDAVAGDLAARGFGCRYHRALDAAGQARIWGLREAALGLSMAMKEDAKALSFVEDTAVAPERLRDYIERFLGIVRRHGTVAGVYAHASVGCLHVRPVVNLKTEEGVRTFAGLASDISDLVLEFGGALSGEHGDGLVRGPFMRKMFGPALYQAFSEIKRTFDPAGIFNPGKIVDCPPLAANLRYGAGYRTLRPATFFDFSEYGGLGGAVEMCSGLGACRKKLEGAMCPSYMATLEEQHTTRGRANVLRLAMAGRLGEAGLGDRGVYETLDLCLECRACKSECPVGVDVARFKSEFLADYHARHGTPLRARWLGRIHELSRWGSRLAPLSNGALRNRAAAWVSEKLVGIDRRRRLPAWRRQTFAAWFARRQRGGEADSILFNDTFTNFYAPEIGMAAVEVLAAAGARVALVGHGCCGRPLISQGMLAEARERARRVAEALYPFAAAGRPIVFCEPSCLSAVKEDAPALLRGEEQSRARTVADACILFEQYLDDKPLPLGSGPAKILLHGHCHQKSMGLLAPAKALLERVAPVIDLDAGCCGMAGSFGYAREHFEISRRIGERRLLPAARSKEPGAVLVASGFSCRHQVADFTGVRALHPAELLRSLLPSPAGAPAPR
ncbi:MAG: FAD-binding protein [Acidobacteria bacterium]|nr:FAD-binding protein [Acidobacteriota bacterium]